MNAFTRALAELCRERMFEEKWLVAPSRRVGHQWLEAVARGGQPAANCHVKTFKHMAIDLVGPALAGRQHRMLTALGGEMLVARLWARRNGGRADGYLAPLAPSRGLFQALHAAIADVRMAGLAAHAVRPEHFEVDAKGIELAGLLEAYRQELARAGLVDYADVLHLAIARLRDDPGTLGPGVLVVLPAAYDLELAALERKLMGSLPRRQLLRLPVDEPCTTPPGKLTDLGLLRWLPDPAAAPPPIHDGTARIVRAVGEVNEVRDALRRALASGIALDDIELLHTDADTYVPLVYELAAGLSPDQGPPGDGLPVTFAEGIPSRYSRPGRAQLAWLAWRREGYPQATLVRMVQDGLLRLPPSVPPSAGGGRGGGDEPPFAAAANTLRIIPIGLRRHRYLPAIKDQIDAWRRRLDALDDDRHRRAAEELQRRLAHAPAVRQLAADLLRVTPASDAPQREALAAATAFLTDLARCATKDDEFARQRLLDALGDLSSWLGDDAEVPGFDVLEWLEDLPSSARILGSGPRPGCLHVAHLASGGRSGRPHTIIVGLDDGRFPGAGLQDPVLLDGERQRLSADLPTARGRLRDKLQSFASLLARLRGSVTLSYPCRSLADDRDLFASPAVLAAHRILSGNPNADHGSLADTLREPASFAPDAPERCLDDADWWLWRLCGPEAVDGVDATLQGLFPALAHGRRAEDERLSDRVTPYGGLVPRAGRDVGPTSPHPPVFSASRLQVLGGCPLAYFFQYVLRIAPPDELEIDPTRWLDALAFGSLLHEVFCRFMHALRRDGLLPEFDRDWPRLQAILDDSVEACRRTYPPPSQSVFRRQQRELLRAADTFLHDEEHFCQASQPLYFEAAIGMPPDLGTPLDTLDPIPLLLPDGTTIRTRGRIDRVDRVGEPDAHTYTVWDYKTGSTSRYDKSNPFRQGRLVQNLLSVRLVERRLRAEDSQARVTAFGYFFPGVRGGGRRLAWSPGELADGPTVIARLCRLAADGCFQPTDTDDDCRFCDYAPICGDLGGLTASSKQKLANPANHILDPFRELREP